MHLLRICDILFVMMSGDVDSYMFTLSAAFPIGLILCILDFFLEIISLENSNRRIHKFDRKQKRKESKLTPPERSRHAFPVYTDQTCIISMQSSL